MDRENEVGDVGRSRERVELECQCDGLEVFLCIVLYVVFFFKQKTAYEI